VRTRTIVERVDGRGKRLRLAGGEEIGFEKLLIATGAVVRTLNLPGGQLAGVHYLRSLDDSKRLRAAYEGAKHAVVLGSGFIGMEVASVLARKAVDTTMLFPEDRVWQRIFTAEMSAFFEAYYEERGVKVVRLDLPQSFEGDGRVRSVVTRGGVKLDADVVVAGIGVMPAVEALKDSGVRIDNGVVVNEYLETDVPDVYAAGDVANYRDVIFETQRRAEHWDNAVEQGTHVARVMLGDRQPFVHVPYFFSDVFDLSYELWGDPTVAEGYAIRGDVTTSSFSVWWIRDRRLVAAFAMNRDDDEREAAQQWIAEHREVAAERLRDETCAIGDCVA
jgi:NADPH-dependent 2,4-dienoyl-CoA reductase/sulfur reductase-like enzyme